jgi:hypothetical protein
MKVHLPGYGTPLCGAYPRNAKTLIVWSEQFPTSIPVEDRCEHCVKAATKHPPVLTGHDGAVQVAL